MRAYHQILVAPESVHTLSFLLLLLLIHLRLFAQARKEQIARLCKDLGELPEEFGQREFGTCLLGKRVAQWQQWHAH